MGLYLVPATRANLEVSMEAAVPWATIQQHLSAEDLSALRQHFGPDGVHCWAMTRTKRKSFTAMATGDVVLMSERGTGKFTHRGTVVHKVVNRRLGEQLWPVAGDKPWELIYFLQSPSEIDVDKEQLVVALGYDRAYQVPGAVRVTGNRLADLDDGWLETLDRASRVTAEDVDLEQHETDLFDTAGTEAGTGRRAEQPMVCAFANHLRAQGHRISARRYRLPGGTTMRCDIFDHTTGTIYEAKSKTDRNSIRLAIGQLLDYRHQERQAGWSGELKLAILLPASPGRQTSAFLTSIGITCVTFP